MKSLLVVRPYVEKCLYSLITDMYKLIVTLTALFFLVNYVDGAKCDIMRLQQMFGPNVKTAVQDPSYPVYVDTSVMLGQTGEINTETMQYSNIVYMPCTPENGFFPDYANHERADVVYICSPKYVPYL